MQRIGSEFMPALDEGTLLYMPTTLPGLSITKAAELLQTQNKIIKTFPEVDSVWGKAGRAATATDPAPTEMFETTINLKPHEAWRPGMTTDKLVEEMDKALQFPGVSNAWTMPIKARIDMLATGIRTPVGVKVFGRDLSEIERLARQIEVAIRTVPGTSSAYAERIIGGYYMEIMPDREQLARYGLTVGDLQDVVASALGAEPVTTVVEGRERYTVSVRYPRDMRSDPQAIAREVLVPLANGASVPLGSVATRRARARAGDHPHRERAACGLHLRRCARARPCLLRRRRQAGRCERGQLPARLLRGVERAVRVLRTGEGAAHAGRAADARDRVRAALPQLPPPDGDADRHGLAPLRPRRRAVARVADGISTCRSPSPSASSRSPASPPRPASSC